MTVEKRYSLGGTSLVLIVFLMTYLDNGPVRRVGYISSSLEWLAFCTSQTATTRVDTYLAAAPTSS